MKTITAKNKLLIIGLFATLGLNLSLRHESSPSDMSASLASAEDKSAISKEMNSYKRVTGTNTILFTQNLDSKEIKIKDAKGKTKKVTAHMKKVIYEYEPQLETVSSTTTTQTTPGNSMFENILNNDSVVATAPATSTGATDITLNNSTSDCQIKEDNNASQSCSKYSTTQLKKIIIGNNDKIKNGELSPNDLITHKQAVKSLQHYIATKRTVVMMSFDGLIQGMFCAEGCSEVAEKGLTYSDTAVALSNDADAILERAKAALKKGSDNLKNIAKKRKEILAKVKKCDLPLSALDTLEDEPRIKDKDEKATCAMDLLAAYVDEDSRLCDEERDCVSGAKKAFKKIKIKGDKDEKLEIIAEILEIFDFDADDYETVADNDDAFRSIINPLIVKHFNLANEEEIKEIVKNFFDDPYSNYEDSMERAQDLMFEELYGAARGPGMDSLDRKNYALLNNSLYNTYCWADQYGAASSYQNPKVSFGGIKLFAGAHKYDMSTCSKSMDWRYPDITFRTPDQIAADLSIGLNNGAGNIASADVRNYRTRYGSDLGNTVSLPNRRTNRPSATNSRAGRDRRDRVRTSRYDDDQCYGNSRNSRDSRYSRNSRDSRNSSLRNRNYDDNCRTSRVASNSYDYDRNNPVRSRRDSTRTRRRRR